MTTLKRILTLSIFLFAIQTLVAQDTTTEPCGAVEIDEKVQTKLSTKACCKKWVKVVSALPANLRQLALDSFDASKDADVCFDKDTFTKGLKEAGKKDNKDKVEGLGKGIKEKAKKTACFKISMTRDGATVPEDQKKQYDQSTTEMGAALGKESQSTSAFINVGLKHANNGFRYLWAKCSEVDSKCNKVGDYIVGCRWSAEKCTDLAAKFRGLLDASSASDENVTKSTEELRETAVDAINKKGGCGCACGKKLRNLDALTRILSTTETKKVPSCKCPDQAGGKSGMMTSGTMMPTGGMMPTGATTRPLQKDTKNTELKTLWEELVKTYPDLNTVYTQLKATKAQFKQGLSQGFIQENKLGERLKAFKCDSTTNFLVQVKETTVTCVKAGTCPDLTSWKITGNQKQLSLIAGCVGARPVFFAWKITGDTSEIDLGKKCDPNNMSGCNGDLPEGCNDDMSAQCKASGLDTVKVAAAKYPDSCDPKTATDESCCLFLQQKVFGTGDMCLKISKLKDIPALVDGTKTLRDLTTSFKLVGTDAEKDLDDSVVAPDTTVITVNDSTPTNAVNVDAAAAIDEKIASMNYSRFVSVGFVLLAIISFLI